MVNWFRQHPALTAAFCVGVVLLAALPVNQFTELMGLACRVGISFAAASFVIFVSPGLIAEFYNGAKLFARASRLAQGWLQSLAPAYICPAPAGIVSVLLPPPRAIS